LETRRSFLRLLTYSVVGTLLSLSTDGLSRAIAASVIEHDHSKSLGAAVTGEIDNSNISFASIRVVYLQMAQYINTHDEYFVLQNPVTVRDLMLNVAQRHSTLSLMMESMWVLVNGMPSRPDALLKDGDEVDFVPLVSGG